MWGEDSRAQVLFRRREIFPLYKGCPHKSVNVNLAMAVQGPPLSDDRKRIVARAAPEANAIRDYWIDTEHLPLGILAEPACLAAQHLGKTGIYSGKRATYRDGE
jgi:hypothetical protein